MRYKFAGNSITFTIDSTPTLPVYPHGDGSIMFTTILSYVVTSLSNILSAASGRISLMSLQCYK